MPQAHSNLGHIDKFIGRINAATEIEQIEDALSGEVKALGFEYFAYWLIYPPAGPRISFSLTNYPKKWIEHYTKNEYRSDDLVGRYSAICTRPFSWQELQKKYSLTAGQRRVFDEAAATGLRAGASFPVHGPGAGVAALSVSNDMDPDDFEELFIRTRHETHLIATYAHDRIITLKFSEPFVSDLKLTARELEVLTWIARGKTRWEAAEILSISEDTIKQHLENACTKLGASNKAHGVAKALHNGLIIL